MNKADQIVEKIKSGEIDINNQELFFSALIKGLMLNLNRDISIRTIPVPHIIIHTGSDALYLEQKGYNAAIEPGEISNESYIYQISPRCIVSPGGIDLIPDQLTNPYSLGQLQYDSGDAVYGLTAEFRRMPLKLTVELKYFVDNYHDLLELAQQIITKLSFIKTYNITYMGQSIQCSYKIPESFSGEHLTELSGDTQDSKGQNMNLSIEVETYLPIYSPKTIMKSDNTIIYTPLNVKTKRLHEIS